MKKFLSLIVSMAIILSMTVISFADSTNSYTITINNATQGHTYEAYQIFKGTLSDSGVLSNIKWGSGVNSEGLGDAEEKAESLKTQANAKAFAKEIAAHLTNPAASTANDSNKITGLQPGYYLIKDIGPATEAGDAYSDYILAVVKNVTVELKKDVPTVEKKVQDIDDSTDGNITDNTWQDSADHDIGDKVPFQLTGTVANNIADYQTYKYVFHDTLSAGLTYNNDVKVYVVNGDSKTLIPDSKYAANHENGNLTVSFADLKTVEGVNANSKIVVEYTATLNENAIIGSLGNPNKVYLQYSNNPNNSGEGNPDTGRTPDDTVIVFTYKVVVNKTDGRDPLTGAEFTLEKLQADGTWKAISVVKNNDGTTFTFKGLDDGQYRLKETVTPEGYNTIEPIEFTVTAGHDILSDNPQLTTLSGTVTTGEITFTPDTTEGSLNTEVVNNKGTQLPGTGGMGTTIFYIVGSILVIGAGVLFVTKRCVGQQ